MMMLITLSRKHISKTFLKRTLTAVFIALLLIGNSSCKSSKPRVVTTKKQAGKSYSNKTYTSSSSNDSDSRRSVKKTKKGSEKSERAVNPVVNEVVDNALSYKGTRYKYGGTTKSGMDCSGLIYTSFKEAGKSVPRTSATLFDAAKSIDFKKVKKGDLLFFATGNNKKKVNHVGLVVKTTAGEVSFVHSSSSRGVMVSTMNEGYWIGAYLSAGRL